MCPFFVSWFWSFGKKYKNDLRVIFDQWPKLSLGLDVQPEIPILNVIYSIVWIVHMFPKHLVKMQVQRKRDRGSFRNDKTQVLMWLNSNDNQMRSLQFEELIKKIVSFKIDVWGKVVSVLETVKFPRFFQGCLWQPIQPPNIH